MRASKLASMLTNLPGRAGLKRRTFLSLLVLVLSLPVLQAQVNMVMNPGSFTRQVGQSFTVDINLQFLGGSADAAAAVFNFDNTVLQVTAVSNAGSVAQFPNLAFPANYNSNQAAAIATWNTNGQVAYAAFTLGTPPSANMTFLSVTFNVIGTPGGGTTNLVYDLALPAPLADVTFGGASVLNATSAATVTVVPACTPPAVVIANTPTCGGGSFNLVLQSSSAGTAPFDLVINGTTYNNVGVGDVITTINPDQNLFGNAAPATNDENDAAVTLGTKFESAVAGYVKGVRFFSHATPSGTYTGQLWDAAGNLLASGTFVGVTGSAWQNLLFTTPVQIAANTTYVVSYHTTTGLYTSTTNYFAFAPTVSGDLTAYESGATPAGLNGVYEYETGPAGADFPVNTFNASNYWVTPIFAPANYTFNLTSVTDAVPCNATGAPLQALNVNSPICGTLPVTLLKLSANPDGNKIKLNWSTATEENNKGFEVLRSLDGQRNWQKLAFVDGAGNSNSTKFYSYTDNNLVARRYFYQLKQMDIDGRYVYSAIVSATIDGKGGFSLEQNFPNPSGTGTTWIRYTLPRRTNITLSLYDLSGRLVRVVDRGTRDLGSYVVPVEPATLGKGVYYYKLVADDFTDTKKLIVQ